MTTEDVTTPSYGRWSVASGSLLIQTEKKTRHGEWWKSCSLYRPVASHSQFLPVLVTSKSSVCVATQAEVGAPGVVVGVSVDGAKVWSEGWWLKLAQCVSAGATTALVLVKCYHVKNDGHDSHYNILYVDWFVHYIE